MLPSIFKSTPHMKPSPASSTQKQGKSIISSHEPSQQVYGLGIQVFKISSKKDLPPQSQINLGNNKSVGKARQDLHAMQIQKRVTAMPAIPKPKKTSAILPSINKTPSQKQYRVQGSNRTQSISRKSVQKYQIGMSKFDPIPEHPTKPIQSQKTKTTTASKPGNKSVEVPLSQAQTTILGQKPIHKQEWRTSLNQLRRFYTQYGQFRCNQNSKAGRKKNVEYLGDCEKFVDAYVGRNEVDMFFWESQSYEHFGIQNYRTSGKQLGFQHLCYEDYPAL